VRSRQRWRLYGQLKPFRRAGVSSLRLCSGRVNTEYAWDLVSAHAASGITTMLMRMCWLRRLQIALFIILIVGMLFLILGHLGSGRSSLTYFAWGMVISVGVVLLNLIFSGVTAIFEPRLRRVSMWIAAVSTVMLVGLVILWRMPNQSMVVTLISFNFMKQFSNRFSQPLLALHINVDLD
jgi:hypothetical protein